MPGSPNRSFDALLKYKCQPRFLSSQSCKLSLSMCVWPVFGHNSPRFVWPPPPNLRTTDWPWKTFHVFEIEIVRTVCPGRGDRRANERRRGSRDSPGDQESACDVDALSVNTTLYDSIIGIRSGSSSLIHSGPS